MSCSYRRTRNGQCRDWLPKISEGDITGRSRFGFHFDPEPKAIFWLSHNPHRIKDVDDWFYWMTEPSWWNRMLSTKPRRVEERRLLAKIKKAEIDSEDTVWPSATKPQHYYW